MMVDLYAGWQEEFGMIALLSTTIFFLINIIKYMFARLFLDQRMMIASVAEILDNIAVAFAVVFLVFIINGVDSYFSYDGQPIHIIALDEAKLHTKILLNALDSIYDYAVDDAAGTYILYSFYFGTVGIPIYIGAWIPSIAKQLSTDMFLAQKTVELSVFLSAQYHVLEYIQRNMLSVFLPLGIILRSMKLTRGLGALFISIAIALYYIYPALLYLSGGGMMAPPKTPVVKETVCNYPTYLAFSRGFTLDLSQYAYRSMQATSEMYTMQGFISAVFYTILLSNLVALSISFIFIRFASVVLGGMPTAFVGMVSKLL